MAEKKQIERISLDRLVGHPANPNRMSEVTFKKLLRHIKRAGNYEPIIVRRHPGRRGCFEIINGHHRAKALGKLGYTEADCVVWDVDDDEVLMLLATLNRLGGNDELNKKSELFRSLSERFRIKELVKQLPESSKSIKRLSDLMKPVGIPKFEQEAFLIPVVFFLADEQKRIVDEALSSAIELNAGTRAQKMAKGIVKVAETFLNREVK